MKPTSLLLDWRRSLALLLLVQIVNLSIDLPDQLVYRRLTAVYGAENLAINEMESLLELAIEWGSEAADAFPEHNEQDGEDQKRGQVLAWYPSVKCSCCTGLGRSPKPDVHRAEVLTLVRKVFSPPPEARLV